MTPPTHRQRDYQKLSTWFQRVILRLGPPHPARSSADEAVEWARNLEYSAPLPDEALALRELGSCLIALIEAKGARAKHDCYAALLFAGDGLRGVCSDFAHPPLNAIWATASD